MWQYFRDWYKYWKDQMKRHPHGDHGHHHGHHHHHHHRLGSLRCARLILTWRKGMPNFIGQFKAPDSPAGKPSKFHLDWTLNSQPYGSSDVPVTAPVDANGFYNPDFNSAALPANPDGTPGIPHPLVPGDVVGVTGFAVDEADNLVGPITQFLNSPGTVPQPTPPAPGPLVGANLVLVP